MAIIFMLAHIVEETHLPLPDEKGNMNNSWAIHQLYTTSDFGRAFEVRIALESWIGQKGIVCSDEDDGGFAVAYGPRKRAGPGRAGELDPVNFQVRIGKQRFVRQGFPAVAIGCE